MNTPGFTAEASLCRSDERNPTGVAASFAPQLSPTNVVQPAISCRLCMEAGGMCLCGGGGCLCV
jgi:hypothetical protein